MPFSKWGEIFGFPTLANAVLDLNECKCWGIDDFNDMDHLSAVGAKKATTLINKAIGISTKL